MAGAVKQVQLKSTQNSSRLPINIGFEKAYLASLLK